MRRMLVVMKRKGLGVQIKWERTVLRSVCFKIIYHFIIINVILVSSVENISGVNNYAKRLKLLEWPEVWYIAGAEMLPEDYSLWDRNKPSWASLEVVEILWLKSSINWVSGLLIGPTVVVVVVVFRWLAHSCRIGKLSTWCKWLLLQSYCYYLFTYLFLSGKSQSFSTSVLVDPNLSLQWVSVIIQLPYFLGLCCQCVTVWPNSQV